MIVGHPASAHDLLDRMRAANKQIVELLKEKKELRVRLADIDQQIQKARQSEALCVQELREISGFVVMEDAKWL